MLTLGYEQGLVFMSYKLHYRIPGEGEGKVTGRRNIDR